MNSLIEETQDEIDIRNAWKEFLEIVLQKRLKVRVQRPTHI
jgi:hypothetical protein